MPLIINSCPLKRPRCPVSVSSLHMSSPERTGKKAKTLVLLKVPFCSRLTQDHLRCTYSAVHARVLIYIQYIRLLKDQSISVLICRPLQTHTAAGAIIDVCDTYVKDVF